MSTTTDDPPLVYWGRVKTGRRFFWTARNVTANTELYDWADTRDQAEQQAHVAAMKLADGKYAHIEVVHGTASSKLRAINAAKRKARPLSDSTESTATQWLYFLYDGNWDGNGGDPEVWRYRITRKTKTRIYYARTINPRDTDPDIAYVDRRHIEAAGEIWHHGRSLFLKPPQLPKQPAAPDLKALKQAMADSHPDRGGDSATFIRARERYVRARNLAKAGGAR